MDNNKSYLIGFQFFKGDYSFTDRNTGEVNQGQTDKFVLYFARPHDLSKQNIVTSSGHSVCVENVRTKMISNVLGLDGNADPVSYLNDLITKKTSVFLDYTITQGANGSQRANLSHIIRM